MEYAIEINNVSKKFKLYQGKNTSLKEKLLYRGKQHVEEIWVLNNINLQIRPGSSVALVGKNGSGKSTLLKLISRILYPTVGEIRVHGKISTLLELGAGFHPDFTGRENIFLNGSILGFTRKEIQAKLDRIIEFSELEHFIDIPVRNYSTGMYMRLGFSVAIHVEPDILLMDEILAVGDYEFQEKCLKQILRLKNEGKTIIFVSHSSAQVKNLCESAVWLDQGNIKSIGPSAEIMRQYEGRSGDE